MNAQQREMIALWWRIDGGGDREEHPFAPGTTLWNVRYLIGQHVRDDVDGEGGYSEFAGGGALVIGLANGTTVGASLSVNVEPTVEVWLHPMPCVDVAPPAAEEESP